ncbi:DUF937 domain-containing protein [Luteipulveratus sp. YIM 133132]|uniref:DUF937 domain-containing protein n=1 Tax=Luteipulveratus flavus TaxID=3031728 RepID=A0ABT6C7K9_9MICO|nr:MULTISPECIES: DUF937 domain-containing protein [unclassified Luteipulveratus]MDE9366428.1 DUF937 domain-containing protein [Luteipulveratus sp. YIM 133132]MDF8264297.1 DUF937 domain-containing protein [Luteipulveratus sp. YIM 133296]
MSAVDDILTQIPIDQLAAQVGADEATTRDAAAQAVPALLSGMQANAQDPGGAASLDEALGQHQGGVPSPTQVDPDEGQAIVGHVFGDHQDAVVSRLGGLGGSGGGDALMKKLLPILAPIVLSYLSNKILKGGTGGGLSGGQTQSQPAPTQQTSDTQGQQSSRGGGGLADVLGGLLGGGGSAGSGGSGGIGDILGGLLGGGRKV